MSIQNLYPTIKPSLMLDFANTKRLDPRITFTRTTTATYYDGKTMTKAEENLIIYSQKFDEADWTTTNSSVLSVAASLSAELVLTGDFASDTNWTKGTGWTIGAGVATKTAGTASLLSQNISAVANAYYEITFTMTRSAGTLSVRLGSTTNIISYSAGGTYTITAQCGTTDGIVYFSADASFAGTVDNVSVKRSDAAPDRSASSVWKITASAANGTLLQNYTAVAGSYTFTVWLRRVTGTGNIEIAADNGTWTTKTISGVWARYDVTQTVAAGSKSAGVRLVTSGDEIEAWGAQLEQRASVTDYIPTTTQPITNYVPTLLTAPAGVPRFDHSPLTGGSLGLLIENQRTNLSVRSQEFSDASWSGAGAEFDQDKIVAPDGTITSDIFIENANNSVKSRSQTISFAAGTTLCISVYVKQRSTGSARHARIQLGSNDGFRCYFDLSSGTVAQAQNFGAGTFVANSASITPVGNFWYRCSIAGTCGPSLTSAAFQIFMQNTATGSAIYQGDGYSGIYLWGAQIEASAFASSYIPTVAASVTRNADNATMTGTNFSSWYNAAEGTLFADINPRELGVTSGFQLNDNTTNNRIRLATNSTSDQGLITTSGTAQATLDGGTPTANTNMKLALAYKADDFALSLNGGTVATDTAGTVPVVNQLQIGAETSTVGNVTVRKIAYYPIRCTNTQLQAITT